MNAYTPAYPTPTIAAKEGDIIKFDVTPGMTLRDYFAGQALAGILSSANFGDTRDWLPQKAYDLADAMISSREGKPK